MLEKEDDKDFNKALCQMCYSSNIDGVKQLVDTGKVDVNYQNGEPLIYTVRGKGSDTTKKSIIQYLIEHGAKIDIREGTVLSWAVRVKSLNLVTFLHSCGMSLDQDGGLPVFYATLEDKPEILTFLLDHGAKIVSDLRDDIYELPSMKRESSKVKQIIDSYESKARGLNK